MFRLLGAKDLGVSDDYMKEKMPAVNVSMLDGHLAWRQHDGGHTDGPNWKSLIPWADKFLGHAPAVAGAPRDSGEPTSAGPQPPATLRTRATPHGGHMIRTVIVGTALIAGLLTPTDVAAGQVASAAQPAAQVTAADAAPFIGEWTLDLQGPNGPGAFDLTVKVEKEKVVGEIAGADDCDPADRGCHQGRQESRPELLLQLRGQPRRRGRLVDAGGPTAR